MRSLVCGLLFVSWLFDGSSLAAHPPSPCPDVFAYEGSEPEYNRWYGEISLITDESLVGIRLDVELDRPADLMVSWMGEITTSDNIKFTVLNLNQRLRPGPPVLSRIMAKFNRSTGSPRVRYIRLNGRKICPGDSNHDPEYGESRPQRPQSTRRPDPEFGENYGENGDELPVNGNNNNDNDYNHNQNNNNNNNNNNNYNNENPPNTEYSPNVNNNNNNRPVYNPVSTTTTSTEEDPYTTRRPIKIMAGASTTTTTTTMRNYPYDQANGNRPNNLNTVSLQASSTDANSEINGVINGLLLNNQNRNKTVIITVIDNNQQNSHLQQNRPNTGDGGNNGGNNGRPVPVENNSSPSSNNRQPPFEQKPAPSNQKPMNNSNNSNHNNNNNNNNNNNSNNKNNNNNQGGNVQQPSSGLGSCGEVKLAVPLVTSGQSTHRGQWPWHVALYMIEGINLSYHCGGSLVSKNKVVTAAHCVTKKQNDAVLNSSKIVVYLGKYHQLQYSDELGVQTKQVIRINVFPSYNSSNFLGDIAVLTLSSDAEFTNYVTPVCLWDEKSDNLDDVVGKDGTVIGWGFDENDTPTEELKLAKMPVVSHQTCLWSYPQFYSEFTSDKTFCAGFRNGTSVCNGDSGGGMVFNRNSRWYLRGIVSITVAKEGLRVCDTKHYVVFTDVAKYGDFIRKNLR